MLERLSCGINTLSGKACKVVFNQVWSDVRIEEIDNPRGLRDPIIIFGTRDSSVFWIENLKIVASRCVVCTIHQLNACLVAVGNLVHVVTRYRIFEANTAKTTLFNLEQGGRTTYQLTDGSIRP